MNGAERSLPRDYLVLLDCSTHSTSTLPSFPDGAEDSRARRGGVGERRSGLPATVHRAGEGQRGGDTDRSHDSRQAGGVADTPCDGKQDTSCCVHTSSTPPHPHHTFPGSMSPYSAPHPDLPHPLTSTLPHFPGSMSSYSASIAKALVDAGAGAEVIAAVLSPDASISGTAAWALEQVWGGVGRCGG